MVRVVVECGVECGSSLPVACGSSLPVACASSLPVACASSLPVACASSLPVACGSSLPVAIRRVYHSSYTHLEGVEFACGCPLLPLKATARGPTHNTSTEETDIVDEAITLFRANVLFRRFDIRGPADKLLVYLTLYINMALKRIDSCPSEAEGIRLLINLGLEPFPIPGDPGFPLAGLFATPTSRLEAETLRTYLQSVREETSNRLLQLVYLPDGSPNKWWLSFSKRKFMNVAMPL
ncbi:unnamed protein product [Closterium sp. NIES-65]|nr:unnamed protein product [Closterium sp. NIES-65]